jgi:tetratricopeptide (TPR) repeat protein
MRKILLAAVFVVPALAWAAPTTAGEWVKEGVNHYTLGNFDKAVDAFKRAFELETDESKRAAYVYNIAQSYRQANDCAKAQFFYRRFLSLKASDTVKPLTDKERKSAEDFIKDLEPCVQQAASLGRRPPEALQGSGDDKSSPPDVSKDHKEPPKDVAVAGPRPRAPGE